MKIERKRLVLLSLLIFGGITAFAQKISKNVMQKIYDEVKTPYKYGMVVAPKGQLPPDRLSDGVP